MKLNPLTRFTHKIKSNQIKCWDKRISTYDGRQKRKNEAHGFLNFYTFDGLLLFYDLKNNNNNILYLLANYHSDWIQFKIKAKPKEVHTFTLWSVASWGQQTQSVIPYTDSQYNVRNGFGFNLMIFFLLLLVAQCILLIKNIVKLSTTVEFRAFEIVFIWERKPHDESLYRWITIYNG